MKPVGLGVISSAEMAYAVVRSGLLGFEAITTVPALIHNDTDARCKRAGITFVHLVDLCGEFEGVVIPVPRERSGEFFSVYVPV